MNRAHLVVGLLLFGWQFAAAQAPLPGTVQPGQIERQFQKPPEPRAVPGGVQIPEAVQQPPANAESIRFVLNRVALEGVTVYPAESLRPAYAGFLGKEVTLGEIYRIADALTSRYRNDGYILSQVIVPAQAVEGGAVRLQAIEGYVAEVRLEGGSDALRASARDYAGKIKLARPLTAAALERYLLLINDIPGTAARGVLAPSKVAGASDLVIQLSQRQFSAGFGVDNRGGRSLGPERYSADADVFYMLGRGARTGVKLVTSGDRKLNFVSLQHDQLLGTEGGKLGLAANISRSEPETFAILPLNLETESETYNATYTYPLVRSRAYNLYVRGTLAAHDGRTQLFGVQDTEDRLRALRVGVTVDYADALGGVNVVDIELSQGIEGLGSSNNGDLFLSRVNGRVDFSKVVVYLARIQPIRGNWSLFGAIQAQYAFTNLLSSELFSYGGEQFGRGHDPSELVGDHGAGMKLELRYTGALPVTAGSYTVYGFYDHGRVRQREPGGLNAIESAASAGVGLRFSIGRHVSGVIEAAKPVIRVVAQEGDQKTRIFGGLSVRF